MQEVIHYHQIDLALLVVAGAVAEVTVEVAATGELWTVQFFDVSCFWCLTDFVVCN